MDKLTHETMTVSYEQALSHILAPRGLSYLFDDLHSKFMDPCDSSMKIEVVSQACEEYDDLADNDKTVQLSFDLR